MTDDPGHLTAAGGWCAPYAVRDGKHLYQYEPRDEGGQGPA